MKSLHVKDMFVFLSSFLPSDLDDCRSDPCRNNAVCVDHINYYSCSCKVGYTGVHCETDIWECASEPCQNGGTGSEPSVGRYMCDCVKGYAGINCHISE